MKSVGIGAASATLLSGVSPASAAPNKPNVTTVLRTEENPISDDEINEIQNKTINQFQKNNGN